MLYFDLYGQLLFGDLTLVLPEGKDSASVFMKNPPVCLTISLWILVPAFTVQITDENISASSTFSSQCEISHLVTKSVRL